MKTLVKPFRELTPDELYAIVQAREKVFLLEQHIICQDLDGVDRDAIHVALLDGTAVLAYLRLFEKDGDAVIGRVLTTVRGEGYGRRVMDLARQAAIERMAVRRILLHSQSYAIPFYEKCGYHAISDEFLEEGIPHRLMAMELVTP